MACLSSSSHLIPQNLHFIILTSSLVSPYKQDVVVKIGIGTIDIEGDVAYKSYLLALDTGSDLIWIQCEECKIQDENHRCYPQKEEPFPDSKSRTFQPLPSSHPLCKHSRSDEKGHCIYTVKYKTESINSTGVLSSETFRFPLLRHQVIAGIFGMSPGPLSFLSQYKPKKFSYCMVPRHVKNPPPTYLRFGSEVKPFTRFQTVDLLMTKATKNHFVLQLEDLGVNGKRLWIDRRRLGNQQLVVDSGSTDSCMLNGAHEKTCE
ncbi:aspartyl protease family protein 2-like [Arachis duranensis]|uniref:Aspartyl protease family protein 2-like n=1 Tax=Arachis duranensis TaxID=130453 RepID=A0A6P4DAD6_ARADU|nr:aspartyl protease family protein 2-like [Arachis duranensis]